jgi:signal transduction histidine kinase
MTKPNHSSHTVKAWELLMSRVLALETANLQLVGAASNTRHRNAGETQRRTDKLRALSVALARAEERERAALAENLHDDLGQLLAVVALKVSTIKKLNTKTSLEPAIADCSRFVEQANRALRAMSLQLAPPFLDQRGFVASLHWLAEELHRAYGIDVVVENHAPAQTLDPIIAATLFRAVRELLVNVVKHAKVRGAVVSIKAGERHSVMVSVCDHGTGFDHNAIVSATGDAGFGLLGIRERLGFLGGTVEIHSSTGLGTTVTMHAPLLLSDSEDARQEGTE